MIIPSELIVYKSAVIFLTLIIIILLLKIRSGKKDTPADKTNTKADDDYRNIIKNIQDVVYRSNTEGKVTLISPGVTRLLGYDSETECIGMDIAKDLYFNPSERETILNHILENGEIADYEITLKKKDGSPVVVSSSSHFFYDREGRIAGVEGIVRDISERKKAEDLFNKAFNENPCPMSISDILTGFYVEVNKAWLDALEFQKEDVIGHTAPELNIYRNLEERNRIVQSIKETGRAHNMEIEFISKNGHMRNGIFFGDVIDVSGKKMLLSAVLNITELRNTEKLLKSANEELAASNEELMATNEEFEAANEELIATNQELAHKEGELRESEKKYRSLIENISEGLMVYDRDMNIIFSNSIASSLLGIETEPLEGKNVFNPLWEIIDEEGEELPVEMFPVMRTKSTGNPVKNAVIGVKRNDCAGITWLLCNTYPVSGMDGHIENIVTTFIDLTERKRAEEEVERLKNYVTSIIDSNPDMLIGIDSEMKITLINRKTETVSGVIKKEAVGMHFDSLLGDFASSIRKLKKEIINRQPVSMPGLMLERNGERHFYNITLYPLISNIVEGAVVLIVDVTDAVKKEDQLRQAQKMETVGTLAGGLAHDFNNVLGGIVGTTSLIRHLMEGNDRIDDRFRKHVELIDKSGKRAAGMVRQLLTLSRKSEVNYVQFDLNSALTNVIEICRNTFDKSIEIITEYSPAPLVINGDPSQVEQVMLNLCINASHAMTVMRGKDEKHGGTLTLSSRSITADKSLCSVHPEASPGRYCIVTQSDTGVGIKPRDLDKIFDPFFTTKEREFGTGLGLSMVYTIVHQHNGFIDVYSEPGVGSTFNIYFPELPANDKQDIPDNESYIEKGNGSILVIDDEDIIRLTAEIILTECGYGVILAGSGREGIRIYNERRDDIKCVLLDMAMPVMSGKDVYTELKKINPEIKVLLASGFRQDSRVQDCLSMGINGFIQKPYSINELSVKIKEITG